MPADPLGVYRSTIAQLAQTGVATEHTYRAALARLLEALAPETRVINEPRRIACGAPDLAVTTTLGATSLTIGYVETKDLGLDLEGIERDATQSRPRTENGRQLQRYLRSLENLVLTNYLDFRWYVGGSLRLQARLVPVDQPRRLAVLPQSQQEVRSLLERFLSHRAAPITNPAELAQRMARLAHLIRDVVVEAFRGKQASPLLRDLYRSFREVLLPDLTEPAFADMFAQTLTYGLFAARAQHQGPQPFRRTDAAREIPRTNPFLRKLFSTIAGVELDDEPFVGFVDELAELLALTDLEQVLADFGRRSRREDPMVHFYETFLAAYDPQLREVRGVYYTPDPVVSYIVRSVDRLLREQFGCAEGLADASQVQVTLHDEQGEPRSETVPRVLILDPACGTGTFLYHTIALIREQYRHAGNAGLWSSYVREALLPRLFGFELLMAPYAMAHLKLGMQLSGLDLPPEERATWAYDFRSEDRLRIYLTNTLEEALKRAELTFGHYISEEANQAATVKRGYPVMVVLGNPPYSGHSANQGAWIRDLLHGKEHGSEHRSANYFEVDGQPLRERNPKWLNDDYVKFIRFGQWRIEQTGYGILAFITNHGYLDNPTFRGMRQSLLKSFDEIYLLNLHGNSKKRERAPDGSRDENVFDIQQGVAIGIFVKRQRPAIGEQKPPARVFYADLWGPRELYEQQGEERRLVGGKYAWLAEHDVKTTQWEELYPCSPFYFFIPQKSTLRAEYEQWPRLPEIMPVNVLGFQTHRDHFAIDFDRERLLQRLEELRQGALSDEDYAAKYGLNQRSEWNVSLARQRLRREQDWQRWLLPCLYRPFDQRYCYLGEAVTDRPRKELLQHIAGRENLCLNVTRQTRAPSWQHVFITNLPTPALFIEIKDGSTVFPLYLYQLPEGKRSLFHLEETAVQRCEGPHANIAPTYIQQMEKALTMQSRSQGKGDLSQSFGPEDLLHYLYAILHAPSYRERYAEFLKSDFPRVPLTSNRELFAALCQLGERLVALHLLRTSDPARRPSYPVAGSNRVERVEFVADLSSGQGRVFINATQYFAGVPEEVWTFEVGGYQVCAKWLKDRKGRVLTFQDIVQYQQIVAALAETIPLMEQIDDVIDEHGGWPLH
ncbi:type ISP restriction/modification enzyme [Thermogemmatispora onikobensis]|uniref:type ISP restriction/modification enzyme n=1 Tax=Thermogemmatispora onikobensis TaxID=732234 RepID=UPI000853C23B|nr:type ISP restriction/modification enzyme [Thermogemmatispora onikobensis]